MKETRFIIVIILMLLVFTIPGVTFSQDAKPCVTIKAAVLYNGPYRTGSLKLARLDAGTEVTPIAAYGDFIRVQVTIDGTVKEGFVEADMLRNLPRTLPQLKQDNVPWQTMLNIIDWPAWNTWSIANNVRAAI